jgi:tripartite-type tricarboxylate transporter receptor subunit TctC
MHTRIAKALVSLLLLALAAAGVQAQSYPIKPTRIIVPHPPGGPGDVPPRGIAQALSQTLGQPFVIENREGADGLIGAEAAVKAAPDGYTLLATSSGTMIINPTLRKDLPYDMTRFAPIVLTGVMQQLILTRPDMPANSMKVLLEQAKAKPESVTVGTMGTVDIANLFVQWTKAELGVSFYPIPYKSSSQALQSALAGDVHVVSYALGPALKLVQAGKMKALAISPRSSSLLPGIPSLREAGVGLDFAVWFGWFAPAGTPRDIVRRLNGEIAKLLADPAFNAKFIASQGFSSDPPAGVSPEELEKFIQNDLAEFQKLVKTVGLKQQ